MADPITELAKEFLEFNGYMVRKESKFYKNKKLNGTPGDLDIIAVSSKDIGFKDLTLKKQIVGEVKNWHVLKKSTVDEIYEDKFKCVDNKNISWIQLKKYFSSQRFDKVLFCFATTQSIYDYAYKKHEIKIVTAGFMIKQLASQYRENGSYTYYPEAYNLNLIRTIMRYLYHSYKYKDKLLIEDLVWIDPTDEPRYRNKFNKLNSDFMCDFIYHDNDALRKMMKRDAEWFAKEAIKLLKKDEKRRVFKRLKRNL